MSGAHPFLFIYIVTSLVQETILLALLCKTDPYSSFCIPISVPSNPFSTVTSELLQIHNIFALFLLIYIYIAWFYMCIYNMISALNDPVFAYLIFYQTPSSPHCRNTDLPVVPLTTCASPSSNTSPYSILLVSSSSSSYSFLNFTAQHKAKKAYLEPNSCQHTPLSQVTNPECFP
jgi:hypothetical protein